MKKLLTVPSFRWVDQTGEVQSLIYQGEDFQGKPTVVFAWYASPATLEKRKPRHSDKFPGIILLHGGAGTAFREWAQQWAAQGYAVLAMDLSGRRPDKNGEEGKPLRLENGGPDQNNEGTFDAIRTDDYSDDWFYHASANAIRAHSLLRDLPGVDPGRTAVTGISWGGILTCAVASLDSRFQAAVPVYGCGFLDQSYFMHSEFEALGPELARRWYSAYDPGALLKDCRTPIFFINGSNDAFFPIDITMKSYEAVTQAPKNLLIIPNFAHGHEPVWARTEVARFVDSILKKGPALPTVQTPAVNGNRITSSYADPGSVAKSATLNYAVKTGPINELKWNEVPATLGPKEISVEQSDLNNTYFFFNLTDSEGNVVSSPLQFSPASSTTP